MGEPRVNLDLLAKCPVCGETTEVFVPVRMQGGTRFWCEECYRRDAPALGAEGIAPGCPEDYAMVGVDAVARHAIQVTRRELQKVAAELEGARRPADRRALRRRAQELIDEHEALLRLCAEQGWAPPRAAWELPPALRPLGRLTPLPPPQGDPLWQSGAPPAERGAGASEAQRPAAADPQTIELSYGEVLELHFLLEGKWPVERTARLINLPTLPPDHAGVGYLRALREKVDPLYAQALRRHPASPGGRRFPLRLSAAERWAIEQIAGGLEGVVSAGNAVGGAREEVLSGLRRIARRFAGGQAPTPLPPEARAALADCLLRLRALPALAQAIERVAATELPPEGRERLSDVLAALGSLQAALAAVEAWAAQHGLDLAP